MIKEYEQSTCETCLAVSLLNIAGAGLSREREREVLSYALDFSKDNFTIGHLDFIAKEYGTNLDFYVDNKPFLDFIKKMRFSGKIRVLQEKIDLKLIDGLIKASPIIIYVDSYYLWKVSHYPHFIIVIRKLQDSYEIFDPWDGKIREISSSTLSKSITSLRNLLKFCPEVIQKR